MSEDQSGNGSGKRTWVEKIGQAFTHQPRDRDELLDTLRESRDNGIVDTDALAMMEGALEVSETQVRDAMIPRSQMVVVHVDSDVGEYLPRIVESGHSRFPVIGEDKDEVIGILLAKDLLPHVVPGGPSIDLASIIRPAVVIPESKRLNVLLRDFRVSHNHMAIVVDEYGGVSGLITIEDVLEEIVGEIDDEYDEEVEDFVQQTGDNTYIVQALTPIDEFNETFDSDFSDDDYGTIGGLLLAQFGRVPEFGEVVTLGERFEFRVVKANNRRIITLEMNVPV
ncbi:MAG: CBS domain-containing protein [Xanthomonadales bacterium]|nr:CBS domain-containing protein [Gammaproteobacteria bacterium]MBT8051305.1 CBS domain-containing protein [Gammaproteobacteria bacterium]MBT8056576.1 CBS domain-containing protein [Gammaproteobacteria bacterium]NNL03783.1 CBS domain-containing protein [Xanthomonadales bacterium]